MSSAMRRDPELWQLLHAGDWACAHGDEEALSRVARALAPRLNPVLSTLAERVGRLAASDLPTASALWGHVAELLRASHAGSSLSL